MEKEEYHRIEVEPLEPRFRNSTNLELWNSVLLERERIRPNLRSGEMGSGSNEPEHGEGAGMRSGHEDREKVLEWCVIAAVSRP